MVLGTRPLGEADLLVVLLTPGGGKIRAAARNARRSRRRFAGGLPGGALGEATLARGRGSLRRLEAFTLLRDPAVLGRDLERFAYVAYLCELTDALVHEPEPDPELFAGLAEAIESVLDGGSRPATLRRYELRLLRTLGLAPAFETCCVCGTPVLGEAASARGTVRFDAARGGALCPAHAGDAAFIPIEVMTLTCALLDAPAEEAGAVGDCLETADRETRRTLRDLTATLVRGHLRRPLRSLEFFAKLGGGDTGRR